MTLSKGKTFHTTVSLNCYYNFFALVYFVSEWFFCIANVPVMSCINLSCVSDLANVQGLA